ncbi:hypothetical protein H6A66_13160 [Bacteroides caecigallinarum]|uniref:DUF6808 domain-containing protein n=1 Tax=Bacteroides caecigallinarum TaxID=1411144 RepID=UPI00195E3C6C|nr:hypothetical protein [Bacteroides caecigallinarum]MBM6866110.1 hypothetical protein [Bacteroides caecigallinarum]
MKYLPYILITTLAFGLGWCCRSPSVKEVPKYDTVQSEPIVVTKVLVDTQYILSPLPYLAWIDHTDTIRTDSCVHLREYKEYQDSNYYARVSGIAPRLDEIRVYPKTVYETQYIYRDVISKPKRWGIGVSAGYGVGKNGFSPVLAVTVNYNLFQF